MPRRTTSVRRNTWRRLTNSAWAMPRNSSSIAGSRAMWPRTYHSGGRPPRDVSRRGGSSKDSAFPRAREAREPGVGCQAVALHVAVRQHDVVVVPQREHRQVGRDLALDLGVDRLALHGIELAPAGLGQPIDVAVAVAPAVAAVGVARIGDPPGVKVEVVVVRFAELGGLHRRELEAALLDVGEER